MGVKVCRDALHYCKNAPSLQSDLSGILCCPSQNCELAQIPSWFPKPYQDRWWGTAYMYGHLMLLIRDFSCKQHACRILWCIPNVILALYFMLCIVVLLNYVYNQVQCCLAVALWERLKHCSQMFRQNRHAGLVVQWIHTNLHIDVFPLIWDLSKWKITAHTMLALLSTAARLYRRTRISAWAYV